MRTFVNIPARLVLSGIASLTLLACTVDTSAENAEASDSPIAPPPEAGNASDSPIVTPREASDASDASDSPIVTPREAIGYIRLALLPVAGGFTAKDAYISATGTPFPSPSCPKERVGDCVFVKECDISGPVSPGLDVGTINVRSASATTELHYDQAAGYYPESIDQFPLWTQPGELITSSYRSDNLLRQVVQRAPATGLVIDPVPATWNRQAPFQYSWSGSTPRDGGEVVVSIIQDDGTHPGELRGDTVECRAVPTANGITFSSALLQRLAPGNVMVSMFPVSSRIDAMGVKHDIVASPVNSEAQGQSMTLY